MPPDNKATVVAGLKPGALCQDPKERMQGVWLGLELSPENVWSEVRGGQQISMVGSSFYLTPEVLNLRGAVSQFSASSETSLAIWNLQGQGQGPDGKKQPGSFLWLYLCGTKDQSLLQA